MKNALLLTILAGFLISGVRAQNPSYFSMEAARERENREREEESALSGWVECHRNEPLRVDGRLRNIEASGFVAVERVSSCSPTIATAIANTICV